MLSSYYFPFWNLKASILKCSNIGNKLKYFVDDSPAKQGFYSPVDHIPIISRKKAQTKLPDYFIILAPNYSDIIIKKEKNFIQKGGRFIDPATKEDLTNINVSEARITVKPEMEVAGPRPQAEFKVSGEQGKSWEELQKELGL